MSMKSSPTRYGTIPVLVHWITAAMVGWLLLSGFSMPATVDPAVREGMLRVHAAIGIAVGILTLFRIAWWILIDRRPSRQDRTPEWQAKAAHVLHSLFYVLILGMAASGVTMMVSSGAGRIVFGGSGGALPDFASLAARVPHGMVGRAVLALIVLHAAAALYHQFIIKDRIFARMGIGSLS